MTDAATTIKIDLAVFASYAVQSACAPPAPARAHPQASRGLARLIGCVAVVHSFIHVLTHRSHIPHPSRAVILHAKMGPADPTPMYMTDGSAPGAREALWIQVSAPCPPTLSLSLSPGWCSVVLVVVHTLTGTGPILLPESLRAQWFGMAIFGMSCAFQPTATAPLPATPRPLTLLRAYGVQA